MSLRLIRAIANTENSDELNMSRILFLLNASSKRGTKTVAGITKLAKLDFLLRYPNCLERALDYLSQFSYHFIVPAGTTFSFRTVLRTAEPAASAHCLFLISR